MIAKVPLSIILTQNRRDNQDEKYFSDLRYISSMSPLLMTYPHIINQVKTLYLVDDVRIQHKKGGHA